MMSKISNLKKKNEQLKEENEQLRKENEKLRKNNDATIKESIKIKSPKEDKNANDNYSNWFDRNKFEKILAIIHSNKFNCKNKIGEFKYIDIKDLFNNIRDNTVGEISAKNGLNKLNEIKNAGIIKYKKGTPKQKELLNLLNDLLDVTLTDKTLKSKSQTEKNANENDKTLMSSNEGSENENENGNENENENKNDKTLMSSNENEDDDEIIKILLS